jgi:Type VI secretion system/phage-baseplate injector OB domain
MEKQHFHLTCCALSLVVAGRGWQFGRAQVHAGPHCPGLHISVGADMSKTFYGKYRGTVINNIDPLQIGRIQAMVPDFAGFVPGTWAMPCVPVAGINSGMFTVPIIGSGVWIEFERGDPDRPIWVGGYWGSAAEIPELAHAVPPGVPGITIQTPLKNGIVVSDAPGPTGGILIQTTTGATISVSDVGIIIANGKGAIINMTGPTVDINLGALTVV